MTHTFNACQNYFIISENYTEANSCAESHFVLWFKFMNGCFVLVFLTGYFLILKKEGYKHECGFYTWGKNDTGNPQKLTGHLSKWDVGGR